MSQFEQHALSVDAGRAGNGDTSVRSFTVATPAAALNDLHRRINATRWPERETVDDTTQVTEQMALQMPPELIGIDTNMLAPLPDDIAKALQFGEPARPAFRRTRSVPGSSWTRSTSTVSRTRRKWTNRTQALRARGLSGRPGRLDARP